VAYGPSKTNADQQAAALDRTQEALDALARDA
jgi:hypothetical protein